MSKPFISPHKVDWEQFFESGYLLEDLATNTIWGGYGQSDSSALSFFHTKFFDKKLHFGSPSYFFRIERDAFWQHYQEFCLNDCELTPKDTLDKNFLNDAIDLVAKIKAGEFEKIVPVTSKEYGYHGHPLSALRKLKNLEGNLYGFWDKEKGIIGCSPEILFRRENGKDQFLALAGTYPYDDESSRESLLNSQKDRNEHQLVVQDIYDKLTKVGYRDIAIEELDTVRFGKLLHLRTPIKASYENIDENIDQNIDISKLVEALHPTAALCGYPEKVAMEELRHQSHYKIHEDDRIFGGVFGFQSEKLSLSVVMIRNIQWDRDRLWIQSGCGLVESSDTDKELEEVQNKRAVIEELLS